MIASILLAVVVLLVVVAVYINSRPASFIIERDAHIEAPAEIVFGLLNDFHRWSLWSPYDKSDPDMQKSYEGAEAGLGAIYAWEGNDKAGQGRMTILDSKCGESVSILFESLRPVKANYQMSFQLLPVEWGTDIIWSLAGQNSFQGKAMSVFSDLEQNVGNDFERGLVNLNKAARAEKERA